MTLQNISDASSTGEQESRDHTESTTSMLHSSADKPSAKANVHTARDVEVVTIGNNDDTRNETGMQRSGNINNNNFTPMHDTTLNQNVDGQDIDTEHLVACFPELRDDNIGVVRGAVRDEVGRPLPVDINGVVSGTDDIEAGIPLAAVPAFFFNDDYQAGIRYPQRENHQDEAGIRYPQRENHQDEAGIRYPQRENHQDESQLIAPNESQMQPIEAQTVTIVDAQEHVDLPWYRQRRTWLIMVVLSTSLILVVIILTQNVNDNDDKNAPTSATNTKPPRKESITLIPSSAPIAFTSSPTTFLDQQYATLKQFYAETGGPTCWKNTNGWSEPSSESYTSCSWFGISCSVNLEVTGIELSNNGLMGDMSLISAILLQIPTLVYINLRSNGLAGDMVTISESMAQLSALEYVDFRFNDIVGSVSSELCSEQPPANILVDCTVECSCCGHEELCGCSDISGWVSVDIGIGCNG